MDIQTTQRTAARGGGTGDLLRADHGRLEILLQDLLAAFAADEPDELRRRWNELDRSLTAHMAVEERLILPAFARHDPGEAASLLAEHGELRRELFELGIAVDLHMIREEAGRRFVARLRDHARREDALLYRWASAHVDRDSAASWLHHLSSGPAGPAR